MTDLSDINSVLLKTRVLVLVGGYGAGKTQVSISLAIEKARVGTRLALVDLDLINPYFRSREVADLLEAQGILVIRPKGDLAYAENPSLNPEIEGVLRDKSCHVVLDVGGDPAGATILGRYRPLLTADDVLVVHVVNIFRPFSSSVSEIIALNNQLEEKSRLKVQGFLNNSNLHDWTTKEDWQRGQEVVRGLAEKTNLPVIATSMNPDWAKKVGLDWNPTWIPIGKYLGLGWKSKSSPLD